MASEATARQSHQAANLQAGDEPQDEITASRVRQWFSDAYKAQSDWRDEVIDNLKMLSGDQWPDELKAKLAEQGMAPIVINRMLMPIMFLSGVQRQTRQEAKLLPFEGGDARSAAIMNALLHWVDEQSDTDERDSHIFLDKMAVGLGWWKVAMNFDSEDLEGQIVVHRRHMLSVFPDPNWLDGEWAEAQYVIDAQWFTPKEAGEQWPDYAEEFKREPGEWASTFAGNSQGATLGDQLGDSLAEERLFWDPVTKRIRILECWYKQRKKVTVAMYTPTGQTTSDPEEVKRLQDMVPLLPPEEQGQIVFVKKNVTLYRVAHLFIDRVLDDEPSPFDAPSFPLFPSLGFYFWQQPFGLADLMKDLQREKNKRRSKLIELVGRMPLSGFFNKAAGGADTKQIEEYGAGNGIVINYETEKPEQIKPPDMPMALLRLEDKSDEEIKDVPNVHNELLGQATQKTISGRAIEARQRGGMVSHEHLFDTFRNEKIPVVKFEIGLIKQFMSPTKALRILGSIAQREPDSPVGQMMQQAQDPAQVGFLDVQQALSDAFSIEYDVTISSRPSEPSLTMQAWETLSEMAQAGAPIPPKVLFESASKAGILTADQVQEILAFIQQPPAAPGAVPPGAVPPGGGPPGPPPPGPAPPSGGPASLPGPPPPAA